MLDLLKPDPASLELLHVSLQGKDEYILSNLREDNAFFLLIKKNLAD